MHSDTDNDNNYNEYADSQQSQESAPQRVLRDTQRERYEQAPPETSGQQSFNSVGQSENGGYSQPQSGYGQPDAQGGNTQSATGYNQGSYNQAGSYGDVQGGPEDRQDGYRDTQGGGYGSPDGSNVGAQEGYDPTHSGVRHSQNRPGQPVDVPGRETGTSWGEDQQMGYTTDTPDRSNPAE